MNPMKLRIERPKSERFLLYEKTDRRLKEHRIKIHGTANFFYPDCRTCSKLERNIFRMQKERSIRAPL